VTTTAIPARRFVINVRVNVPTVQLRHFKRQSQIGYVKIQNDIISIGDRNEAAQLEFINGELTDGQRHFAFLNNRLQFVRSGGTSRTFSFDANGALQWQNTIFPGNRASFCSRNGLVEVEFNQRNGCDPIQLSLAGTDCK